MKFDILRFTMKSGNAGAQGYLHGLGETPTDLREGDTFKVPDDGLTVSAVPGS